MWEPSDDPSITPFRRLLVPAGNRLEELALRSSPSAAAEIRREVTAVREASRLLEGEPCEHCGGRNAQCGWCGGRGDLCSSSRAILWT